MFLKPTRSGGWGALAGLGVWLLTLAVFRACLENGFVNWDDPALVLNNASVQRLGFPALVGWLTSFDDGSWVPLSRFSLALDFWIWGRNPFGFHLTGLLLHSFNAGFVFLGIRLFLQLRNGTASTSPRVRDAAAVAAACWWALHPLRVESVAWVSERRDVLSGFFSLLAILAYLRGFRGEGAPRRAWNSRGWVTVLFGCALMSKANAVPLPVFLVLLDGIPLGRIRAGAWRETAKDLARCLGEKGFLFAMAFAAGGVALCGQRLAGAAAGLGALDLPARMATAVVALTRYLLRTVVPVDLNPLQLLNCLYTWRQSEVGWAAVVLTVLGMLLVALGRRAPVAGWAWLSFLVLIGPFLGIFQVGGALMADRYTYLAAVPLAMGVGVLAEWGFQRGGGSSRAARGVTGGALVLLLVFLALGTTRQVLVWRDSETLWRHSLSLDALNPAAWRNLADALHEKKQEDQAVFCAREAVRLAPGDSGAWFDLGFFLQARGFHSEALACYRRAAKISPSDSRAFHNQGWVLAELGRLNEALAAYALAWKLAPAPETLFNIARCLQRKGDAAGAISRYREAALAGFDEAWIRWGQGVVEQGDERQGIAIFREGMRRSASLRLRIAFAETVLSLPRPQKEDLQTTREVLTQIDQRARGGSQKVADLLRRLDARAPPEEGRPSSKKTK